MPFEFNELNMQLMPDDIQYHHHCVCLSRPNTLIQNCFCRSNAAQSIACYCNSRPYLSCRCLSSPRTLPCICNSLPIQSYPFEARQCLAVSVLQQVIDVTREIINPRDLDVLREELNQALRAVDIQQEVMERTLAPQSAESFDAAEKELTQQLESLRKQREQFTKSGDQSGGGGGGGGGRKAKS